MRCLARWQSGCSRRCLTHGSVIVALPSVARDLRIELASVQWVVIAYALTISALLLPMGRLADMIGQKRVYILGTVHNDRRGRRGRVVAQPYLMLLARTLQGVGSAMTQGTGMAIMTSVFPSSERGRAIGLLMTTVGVGAVAGPSIGGFIVDLVHWRAVFFLTIPLALLGMAATLAVLRGWESERAARGRGFDWPGAALSTGVLVTLLLGLTLAVESAGRSRRSWPPLRCRRRCWPPLCGGNCGRRRRCSTCAFSAGGCFPAACRQRSSPFWGSRRCCF